MQIRALVENSRNLVCQLSFDAEPAPDRTLAILFAAHQRHPVVVKVTDIFIRQIVQGVAQILPDPGMLTLGHAGEHNILDPAAHCGVGVPEPALPQRFDCIHAHRNHWIGSDVLKRRHHLAPARQSREVMRKNSRCAPPYAGVRR